jgi:hypothetical protein
VLKRIINIHSFIHSLIILRRASLNLNVVCDCQNKINLEQVLKKLTLDKKLIWQKCDIEII